MVWRKIKGVLRQLAERVAGVSFAELSALQSRLQSMRAQIEAQQIRLLHLEKALDFVASDEINRWLFAHRSERMDATVDFFQEDRRRFHMARYEFASQRVRGKRVLDCACGTGYGVRRLREAGSAASVLGIDIDPHAIEYARSKHMPPGTEYSCAPGTALPLGDCSLEVITSFETIEHVSNAEALLAEFHRVLELDGLLMISTPNDWPLEIGPHHVRAFDLKSFREILTQAGFDVAELWNQNSGSDWIQNHGQPAGFVRTTPVNEALAECLLAICVKASADETARLRSTHSRDT